MIDRIIELIKIKNLSAAQFADEIGVQRSSMSHLMSGRNNPSLEFVQKVLKRFPEIRTDWLLFGKGSIQLDGTDPPVPVNSTPDLLNQLETTVQKPNELRRPETEKGIRRKGSGGEGKKIEKIVFFYTDNTYREFLQEQ